MEGKLKRVHGGYTWKFYELEKGRYLIEQYQRGEKTDFECEAYAESAEEAYLQLREILNNKINMSEKHE